MSYLQVDGLIHKYGDFTAIDDVSFSIEAGERLCLLGPSGCGKTTTLQAIAGFIQPASGRISVAGEEITGLPSEKRNIGIMFQNYALFPHMTVFENVAFGLRMRQVPRREIKARVGEALKVVRLEHKARNMPSQLSGGEQQRIAFARAIVIRPRLLLLDEPFSNLDARLRLTMRAELLELLEGLDIATLMVTHDQDEAMAIGHRIAVMRAGRIRQIGAPRDLYRHPNSRFVGEFLGESNLFPIQGLRAAGSHVAVDVPGVGEILAETPPDDLAHRVRYALVRPEKIRILPRAEGGAAAGFNRLNGTLEHATFLGPRVEARIRVGEMQVQIAAETDAVDPAPGQPVTLSWPVDATVLIGGDDD
ncbi:ABC transporter ATP-binding protein [Acuticoccus sediminis]|nr:ABC transporter ATP-binding protein [Acuticoccus sediminis]